MSFVLRFRNPVRRRGWSRWLRRCGGRRRAIGIGRTRLRRMRVGRMLRGCMLISIAKRGMRGMPDIGTGRPGGRIALCRSMRSGRRLLLLCWGNKGSQLQERHRRSRRDSVLHPPYALRRMGHPEGQRFFAYLHSSRLSCEAMICHVPPRFSQVSVQTWHTFAPGWALSLPTACSRP
jgi:hypothetical protein